MTIQSYQVRSALSSLQQQWVIFAGVCALVSAAGYLTLSNVWESSLALRWLVQANAVMVYQILVLWRGLPLNHRQGEAELLSFLGAGNIASLFRGVLLACMAGFLFSPRPEGWLEWLPGLLYSVAVLADFLDGYLARLTNHATRLGEILDLSLDGLGVLAAGVLAVQYGQAPAWYLAVPVARYIFLGVEWLLHKLDKPVYPLPPSITRRGFAGVQMGFAAVLLLPLFSPPGTHVAAVLLAAPFLVGFTRDGLYLSGVLAPSKNGAQSSIGLFLARVLPLVLRLGVVSLLGSQALAHLTSRGGQTGPLLLGSLEVVVLILVGLGAAGRGAAIAGLCLLGAAQALAGLTFSQYLLAAFYSAILYLGTGSLSLWKPENRLIFTHLGKAAK